MPPSLQSVRLLAILSELQSIAPVGISYLYIQSAWPQSLLSARLPSNPHRAPEQRSCRKPPTWKSRSGLAASSNSTDRPSSIPTFGLLNHVSIVLLTLSLMFFEPRRSSITWPTFPLERSSATLSPRLVLRPVWVSYCVISMPVILL